MTLTSFEQHLDGVILERGQSYYESGLVDALELGLQGWWEARVEGSEEYRVHIRLSPAGEVLEATCDCPCECGPTASTSPRCSLLCRVYPTRAR